MLEEKDLGWGRIQHCVEPGSQDSCCLFSILDPWRPDEPLASRLSPVWTHTESSGSSLTPQISTSKVWSWSSRENRLSISGERRELSLFLMNTRVFKAQRVPLRPSAQKAELGHLGEQVKGQGRRMDWPGKLGTQQWAATPPPPTRVQPCLQKEGIHPRFSAKQKLEPGARPHLGYLQPELRTQNARWGVYDNTLQGHKWKLLKL